MNYFDHPYCSNSDLSRLKQELSGKDAVDTTAAFHFGTLVHAMVLEPHRILTRENRIIVVDHQYNAEDFETARKMRLSVMNDSFCRNLVGAAEMEVEMYHENTRFSYNGIHFTLHTRRKYDGFIWANNWGFDLKSTTATSQQAFEASINMFDYDRARVFYAMGPGAVQDVIIGVSKVRPYRVFKVFMRQNDPLWLRGVEKCNEIAYRYWALKEVAV